MQTVAAAIVIPANALVLMVGPAGSGKSSFAEAAFPASAIVSSDAMRERITDDITNQACSAQAYELMRAILGARLEFERLAVADATNVTAAHRQALYELAAHQPRPDLKPMQRPIVVLVMACTLEECLVRNRARDRVVPDWVIERQYAAYVESLAALRDELPGETVALVARGQTTVTIGEPWSPPARSSRPAVPAPYRRPSPRARGL
jgi:protein phosphatase